MNTNNAKKTTTYLEADMVQIFNQTTATEKPVEIKQPLKLHRFYQTLSECNTLQ